MNYERYFKDYNKSIYELLDKVNPIYIERSVSLIETCVSKKGKVYIAGNGGSSSIASHVSVDFAKVAGVSSATFNNANLITCFANDYGYENWLTESIKAYLSSNDILILISSSGTSKNIVNAAKYCSQNKIKQITLSGFSKDNALNQLGDVNFHIESDNYNFIEMSHHIILVSIVDIFAKNL